MMRRLLLALPLLVCALLAAGFAQFLQQTRTPAAAAPPTADGIVVLTGGADRIATGLRLLAEGRGRILLVSGVGGPVAFPELARRAGANLVLASRVTLGREAASTYGNAQETAAWARARKLASLLVVTAYYHMPRALAELSRALPGVALHPVPVQPVALGGAASWRLLAAEYGKFLATKAGLSAWVARVQPPPPPPREQQTARSALAPRVGG
jgi:uncharacterized SAM-binding protein YcdF (DUF218 family)